MKIFNIFSKNILTFLEKMIKYSLNWRYISMIRLIDKIMIDYSKKISARNKYYTSPIYSCFYSCSNKNNISKSVSVETL